MLSRTALLALASSGALAQLSNIIGPPPCLEDDDCDGPVGCNTTELIPGNDEYYFCELPDCSDPEFARRRVDGICNNLVEGQQYWGARHEFQLRDVPAGPDQDIVQNPSALDVSDLMFETQVSAPNTFGMSNLLIIFGQFVDHDISLVEPTPDTGTVTFTATGIDNGDDAVPSIEFPLSESFDVNEVREFRNGITSILDLSQVYGDTEDRLEALRQPGTPLLRVQQFPGQDRDFLPAVERLPNEVSMAMGNIPESFAAGDIRANEEMILTAFHTLWVRNHNKIAEQFEDQLDDLSDDELFDLAKARNIAEYQNIVYQEFLPGLLGGNILEPYQGYDETVSPQMDVSFVTSLYRMGHSGVSNLATAIDSDGVVTERTLADIFFAPQVFIDQNDAVGAFLLGSKQICHERMDLEMTDSLRRLLFANTGDALDLGALNVARGRDHNSMSMNQLRETLGMPEIGFNQLTDLQCIRDDFNDMFNDIDDAPLFAAAMAEDPEENSQLGPTLTAAIAETFTRLRDGDRYYFENRVNGVDFAEETIREIRATKMSDIIQRNTFIAPEQIGVNAFESDQCCFRGGNAQQNLMCVRDNNGVSMQVVDRCDVADMAAAGEVFSPGTVDPATNTEYDCNCVAAAQVIGSSSTLSASLAAIAAAVVGAMLF